MILSTATSNGNAAISGAAGTPNENFQAASEDTPRPQRVWVKRLVRLGIIWGLWTIAALFFSTQVAAGPDGVAPELLPHPELPFSVDGARVQAHAIFDSLSVLCEAAGTTIESLCQVKEFYEDLRAFPAVRQEWAERFGDSPPASTSVEVGAPLIAPDAALLMDAIGYAPARR